MEVQLRGGLRASRDNRGEKEEITSWEESQLTLHGWHCPTTLGLISEVMLMGKKDKSLQEQSGTWSFSASVLEASCTISQVK